MRGNTREAQAGEGESSDMARLEKRMKQHQRGDIPHVDWLDSLVFRKLERVHAAEMETTDDLLLYVDLPEVAVPVVFAEPEPGLEGEVPSASGGAPGTEPEPRSAQLAPIVDPAADGENLVEAKHRRLVRSQRTGLLDRDQKPTAAARDELRTILLTPPSHVLSPGEMDLVWSYRFYLTRDPKGLTKFLKSVVWSDAYESRQATEVLLPMWAEAEMSDALELLGPAFRDLRVRAYAVRRLHKAADEELALYLLQLVQALKFDEAAWRAAGTSSIRSDASSADDGVPERLCELLLRRSVANVSLGATFYWYVTVEAEGVVHGRMYRRIEQELLQRIAAHRSPLAEMLVRQRRFVATLSDRCKELRFSRDARPRKIERLHAMLADTRGGLRRFDPPLPLPLDARVHIVRSVPQESTVFKSNLFPLRICFRVEEEEVESDGGELSRASTPSTDEESSGVRHSTYTIIFKNGDDLRQDQLVIQLFMLMDRLLRNENLDLRITPYHVLATSAQDGMVQYVPSMPIASIMAEYGGSLLTYMRHHYPDPENAATFGVQASVLDTFVRSCAGYCVITYLLGVGDRHLDNLLLTPDGHFFHVDFGYIFGRDPKPFPPPVKICKEMVDAMGGTSSVYYGRFKKLCHIAFSSLRKNASLILNLVALMVDADIPDIRAEPDRAVLKVQDKFLLHLSEDKAAAQFEALLNETSYISTMFDRLHNMAQYFRQ